MMPSISVIICCADVGDTIESACQSVSWADELLIVDSGSRDQTSVVARRYAHHYIEEPWRGHTGQKRFASELAQHDWIFFLDGDEECSPQLAQQWQQLTDQELDQLDLFLVPRRNYLMGRWVRAWWPDRLTRIFHRHRCSWDDQVLHDRRMPSDPSRVRRISGWIEHKRYSRGGFTDYFSGRRFDDRLLLVARQMHEQGYRAHWWDLLLRPVAAFAKFYFFKRGFLDGTFGLLVAQKAAVSTQLKYAALWSVTHQMGSGPSPDRVSGSPAMPSPASQTNLTPRSTIAVEDP